MLASLPDAAIGNDPGSGDVDPVTPVAPVDPVAPVAPVVAFAFAGGGVLA